MSLDPTVPVVPDLASVLAQENECRPEGRLLDALWEKKGEKERTYLAMLHFGCALIVYKRTRLLG